MRKKLFLSGVAALFLATGTAHAYDAAKDYRPNYDMRAWEPAEPPGSEKDKELAEAQRLRAKVIARNPKRAGFCVEQFGQDGEALESPEEEANFDYCMKSLRFKEICSVYGKDTEFESKAEYKRCLARLARGSIFFAPRNCQRQPVLHIWQFRRAMVCSSSCTSAVHPTHCQGRTLQRGDYHPPKGGRYSTTPNDP
jgi:hypothetical protein